MKFPGKNEVEFYFPEKMTICMLFETKYLIRSMRCYFVYRFEESHHHPLLGLIPFATFISLHVHRYKYTHYTLYSEYRCG